MYHFLLLLLLLLLLLPLVLVRIQNHTSDFTFPKSSSMVTIDTIHPSPVTAVEAVSSTPRISFSAEFLEEPKSVEVDGEEDEGDEDIEDDDGVSDLEKSCSAAEFEFLSTNASLDSMLSADELFREGKLLPKFWLAEQSCEEKLENAGLRVESRKGKEEGGVEKEEKEDRDRGNGDANPDWFMDEDPSPRPPKCTVLWKELLRLRKQRAASAPSSVLLSPSSSSSSTSSSSSSMADVATKEGKDGTKGAKRIKKGGVLERTSSGTVRIRPMINVPICTVAKASRLQQPLFPLKKGRISER